MNILAETFIIGFGTYLFRAISVNLGSRTAFPAGLKRWLTYVTPAVLGALIGPALFVSNHHAILTLRNPALLAAVLTVLAATLSRNLLLSVAAGVVSFACFSLVF